ncbi:S8 family serine peptidase [Thermomonospora umbrina]|uniref:S8 family serine peptidase n=1 Tax=Thermomonospora umbrina TaxID=111806 RepID=UPI0014774769|nr:S8 family serine peptidase [Thermomonospora umbrina]
MILTRSTRWAAVSLFLACALAITGTAGVAGARDTAEMTPALERELADGGRAAFFVMLRGRAELRAASTARRHSERTAAGHRALTRAAERDQRALRRMLAAEGVRYEAFWIVNTLLVHDADRALAERIAARPEVERLVERRSARRPDTVPTGDVGTTDAGPEWNVAHIGAPRVWSELGTRGEGIVVAGIDTGVRHDHPALVGQYRGRRADGSFVHDYNWYDPQNYCERTGRPAQIPCDLNGHGSHTLGTAVGDDGAGNQIGVAPGAKWIAVAAGGLFLLQEDLLRAGQWVLAPTDRTGAAPRPDLAPHVVNNSWGWENWPDDFYTQMIDNWIAVGIFPVFGSGNSGPNCGTVIPPGQGPGAYSVGAYDGTGQIWSQSSRGPSPLGGETKPNIAAPGVNIRSVNDAGGYESLNGTSMATPHVTGTVALMWSKAPQVAGDIARTKAILDLTATDVADTSCGGAPSDNNVYGEGRLNARNAVELASLVPAR